MSEESIIRDFYEAIKEDERLYRRPGQIEWFISCKYIDMYLSANSRILEIGAGTGRYALHYARQGYAADAVELVQANLDVLNSHIQPGDNIRAVRGNALDLRMYEDNSFDNVLLLGPMYHLFNRQDKLKCLSAAYRVCKPGGIVSVAYCQFDPSMIQHAFIHGAYPGLIENGYLDGETHLPISNPQSIFELHRKKDIDSLNAHFNWQRLHYVGTDMFAHYMEDTLDNMDEVMFGHYLNYTLSICENEDLTGVSNHVLDVLKKPNL